MDEYVIIPKRMMDQQKLATIHLNREPPEAHEVASLHDLTSQIIHRTDMTEWEKAHQLSKSLERFLAMKHQALGPSDVFQPPPAPAPPQRSPSPKLTRQKKTISTATAQPPPLPKPLKPNKTVTTQSSKLLTTEIPPSIRSRSPSRRSARIAAKQDAATAVQGGRGRISWISIY